MSKYLKSIKAILPKDYAKRTKKCEYCGVEFCDVTKRNLKHTCTDKCRFALMVQKRHERGNYERTEIQNQRLSQTLTHKWETGEITFSEEQRHKNSIAMANSWATGKIKSENLWAKTPEGRKFFSEISSGRVYSDDVRHNMSLAQQKRKRTSRECYTSAHGGIREDLNQYFRSNWEANFARILNYENKTWFYEECTFQLTPGTSYTPDFYLLEEDKFVEIKGRMDERSKYKLDLMKIKFPWIKIELVEGKEYKELRKQYKDIVNWEGK